MKSYSSSDDLHEFGIHPLTGEACGLNMRCLCDLTARGVEVIRDFFRVEPTAEAWNRGDDPYVASIMLPYPIFEDLWTFAVVRAGYKYVFRGGWVASDEWVESPYTDSEGVEHVDRYPDSAKFKADVFAVNEDDTVQRFTNYESFYISRWYRKSSAPGTGIDNQHAMSGRIQ